MVTEERQREIDERKRLRLEKEKNKRATKVTGVLSKFGIGSDPAPDTRRQSCEASDGTWDAVNEVCIPIPLPEEEAAAQADPALETFTDPKTGRASGITLPDGRTFLGLSPEDVQAVAEGEQARVARPEGTAPVGTAQAQALQQQRIQQQIAQIGQLGTIDPAVQADINFSQAVTAGLAGAIPGAIGGAAVGAGAGLVGTGGALSLPGAIAVGGAGLIGGFVSGIIGNIKEQQRGELQAADIELTNARTNMRQLAMLATQDPANADIYISQYNQQLTRIHQARRQTKAEVSGDLNAWMEDGREQLADFDAFLQEGGIADVYGQKLAIALQSGVPLSINGETLV